MKTAARNSPVFNAASGKSPDEPPTEGSDNPETGSSSESGNSLPGEGQHETGAEEAESSSVNASSSDGEEPNESDASFGKVMQVKSTDI